MLKIFLDLKSVISLHFCSARNLIQLRKPSLLESHSSCTNGGVQKGHDLNPQKYAFPGCSQRPLLTAILFILCFKEGSTVATVNDKTEIRWMAQCQEPTPNFSEFSVIIHAKICVFILTKVSKNQHKHSLNYLGNKWES